MTKKKQTDVVDKIEDNKIIGTPTMALLPARNYCFKVIEKDVKVTIPRSGVYEELNEELYMKEDGEFFVYDEESSIMYMPSISKILFGMHKYPDLKNNQLFVPIALIFSEKEIEIRGQTIEMLDPVDNTIK